MLYLLILNVVAFTAVIVDKSHARKNKSRISESTLFTLALLGGAVGEYASMRIFRHKTLHKRFMLGLPAIIAIQLMLIYVYRGLWL